MSWRHALVFALLASAACAGPPPDPPTAVIDATPPTLCEGDAFATPVTLSGARSSAALSLVPTPPSPGAEPLIMTWRLTGAEFELESGSLHGQALTVRAAGDRPLHAELTVEDEDGGVATTLLSVPIAATTLFECGDACPEGARCEQLDGASVCLPDVSCVDDDECPPCFACDVEARCVPR